jgi:O-antigen/teichoic acid export membrane protein
MLDKFRTLLANTLIYGLGNYGIKIIGFLLIPLYTRYLSPEDYGVIALVAMYTQVVFVFMNLGQNFSVFRFYYEHDTDEGRARVVAAAMWIVFLFALPLASLPLFFSRPLAQLILGDSALWYLMLIGTATVLCKVLLRMPFSLMRAGDQAKRYATWSVVRNGTTTALAVALVAGVHLGATGVVLSQFLGEVIMCVILTGVTFRMMKAGFHWSDIKQQLLFGLPLIPGGIAAFSLDLLDRWLLKHYASVSDVGLYSLGYRFGEILAFVVAAFQLSWPQFVFAHRKDPDAPQIYAQMTTYWTALLFFAWLGLALAAPEMLRLMATPAYYAAGTVIPVIAFAMALDGLTFTVNIGVLFSKKLILRTFAVTSGAIANIVLNVLFIPRYGIQGAAWATLAGFGFQVGVAFVVSRREYYIPYPWFRLLGPVAIAIALYLVSIELTLPSIAASIALKAVLLAVYPLFLLAIGFVDREDLLRGLSWVQGRVPATAPAVRALRPLARLAPVRATATRPTQIP